jgi:hypothetical protein
VIIYRDRQHVTRSTPPACLSGAADLQCRESAHGRLWGIGDGRILGPDARWIDIGDGWDSALIGEMTTRELIRDQRWVDVEPVSSLTGITWIVPKILTPECSRAFRVAYGKDWLPALTPEQARMEAIARAAWDALTNPTSGIDMAAGCQWAAEMLCAVNHISVEAIQAHQLLDEDLALGCLATATTLRIAVKHA